MPNENDQYHIMRMNGMSPSGLPIPEPEPTEELRDTDPMPFGKYKGQPMQDVPASYLHYLWTTGLKGYQNGTSPQYLVADYIRRNLNALRIEHHDGLWA